MPTPLMLERPPAAAGSEEPAGRRRGLLAELGPGPGPVTLADHRRTHPLPPAPGTGPWWDLIERVDAAGLTGRGGAGFPTGRKLRTVAEQRRRPVVVVNGTEGEPASGKDRLLLSRVPHLVLDGALWAAAAVGADLIAVGVEVDNRAALAALRRALDERLASEGLAVGVEVVETPPRYVAGEETALVHFLDGGTAAPTATPPRPFERGLGGAPTLVDNVETVAHLAHIAHRGAQWWRSVGTADSPGTSLFSVSGAVCRPSVVEAPGGTTIGEIIGRAGGVSEPIQAVLVGGYFGTWVAAPDAFAAPATRAGLAALGAAPGAGILIALPATACGLQETARLLTWYGQQSAGQCGPCRFGLPDLAGRLGRLSGHRGSAADVEQLVRWAGQIEGRGGCRHPDGAVRLLRSALQVFAADVDEHLRRGPCAGAGAPPCMQVPLAAAGSR